MVEHLTKMQAYAAMLLFLRRYSKNTKTKGEIGALISGMPFVTDGEQFETMDPAYWEEWLEDVEQVLDASRTEEAWDAFADEHLLMKVTAPDGTTLYIHLDSEQDTGTDQ